MIKLIFSNQNKLNFKRNSGFTLLELIVSISILLVLITAFSSMFFLAFRAQKESQRVTAAYLAQEAVEVIQNIRDMNYIKSHRGELTEFNSNISEGTGGLQYNSLFFPDPLCSSGYLQPSASGFFECTTNTKAPFKRLITVSYSNLDGQPPNVDRINILVKVEWNGGKKSLTLKSEIYDWLR